MNDWSSEDYTKVYGDTLYVPPDDNDLGIYLANKVKKIQQPCKEPMGNRKMRAIYNVAYDERPPNWTSLVPHGRESFTVGKISNEMMVQYIKIVLLFIIVVLMTMTLMTSRKVLAKLMKEDV